MSFVSIILCKDFYLLWQTVEVLNCIKWKHPQSN